MFWIHPTKHYYNALELQYLFYEHFVEIFYFVKLNNLTGNLQVNDVWCVLQHKFWWWWSVQSRRFEKQISPNETTMSYLCIYFDLDLCNNIIKYQCVMNVTFGEWYHIKFQYYFREVSSLLLSIDYFVITISSSYYLYFCSKLNRK